VASAAWLGEYAAHLAVRGWSSNMETVVGDLGVGHRRRVKDPNAESLSRRIYRTARAVR